MNTEEEIGGRKPEFDFTVEGHRAFSGSTSLAFQSELIMQMGKTLYVDRSTTVEESEQKVMALYEAMQNIAPRDELESMLAAQMISAHNAGMECLHRAASENQTFEGRDLYLKHAAKLMGLYERHLTALDKHRGKGQQKITVEHVTVEAGGQAIVGEVHTQGRERSAREQEQRALPDYSAAEAIDREPLNEPGRQK